MKYIVILCASILMACSVDKPEQKASSNPDEIHTMLDGWHEAASQANFEKYFNYFENDSSIFIGTDATERWTIAEFRPWSKPFFDSGKAWSFIAESRVVYFSENGLTAWFDETLATPNLGPCRGSGVLNITDNGWKISHYNLSVPIPNEIVNGVVKQIESTLAQ